MQKKVAIIACAMALPGEKGYSRFAYLANLLTEKNFKVDLYTSTFNHWEKAQRKTSQVNKIRKNVPYNIFLGHEFGYKKNVEIRRVASHIQLSNNIIRILAQENKKGKYDLLYCVIPDNYLAARVAAFGKKVKTPVIIDIEDLWPEGMKMMFHTPVISDLILSPFRFLAKSAYKNANAFVGTSDEFRDEPVKYHEAKNKERITVYVGCDLEVFDGGVKKFAHLIEKSDDEFWVIYTGTLGTSYDIRTLIKAAQIIKGRGYENIKIKILGGGPLENEFKALANEAECNVDFLGYQPYEKMAAYIVKSNVTVNSFVKSAPQSIVNKVGDYLAGGKPMINTLSSHEFQHKVKTDEFGINITAEDADKMAAAILFFYKNSEECIQFGKNAREIAQMQFDRKNAYQKIVDLINDVIKKCSISNGGF